MNLLFDSYLLLEDGVSFESIASITMCKSKWTRIPRSNRNSCVFVRERDVFPILENPHQKNHGNSQLTP